MKHYSPLKRMEIITFKRRDIGFPNGSVVKILPASAGDVGDASLIPGLGRSLGGGNGNLLQYSCLENSMNRGAWWATVHGITKVGHDWATKHTHTHIHSSNFSKKLLKTRHWSLPVLCLIKWCDLNVIPSCYWAWISDILTSQCLSLSSRFFPPLDKVFLPPC